MGGSDQPEWILTAKGNLLTTERDLQDSGATSWRIFIVAGLAGLGIFVGCNSVPRTRQAEKEGAEKQADAIRRFGESKAIQGTIGSYTSIEGMLKLPVRGYGLVVGLGKNGSQNCPQRIRKRLSAEIRKKYGLGDSRLGQGRITPEKMIASPDTAVVFVEGDIGAASLSGTSFDLTVQALPGTETTSLEGGRLYTCDLFRYRQAGGGMVQEGKVVARGAGPIFINPFSQRRSSATPANLRTAKIIGGGTNLEDRMIRLVLFHPSYPRVTGIQDKINNRLGFGKKIAVAESPSYISLEIPRSYSRRELFFVSLVRHFFLSSEGGFEDRRAIELAAELSDLQAPHDSIGLALEGIGRKVRPVIRDLYTHKLPHVNYFAARTGLHLHDKLAIPVLKKHALDPDSPYQLDAIRDLGAATATPRAANVLWAAISSDFDAHTRILAYEGLLNHQDPLITSTKVGADFFVDHMPISTGSTVIYARVSSEPRFAIIGNARCRTPLFYRDTRGTVIMNADNGDTEVTVSRTTPSGNVSPPTAAPLELKQLIPFLGNKADQDKFGQVTGLGLDYGRIIDIVSALCENGTIDAEFRIERPGTETIPGARRKGGRPESDL